MKGIIVYKGKYGATRQYAQWLGVALRLPVADAGNTSREKLADFDFVIMGTSVYIGKLQLAKWLRNNFQVLQNKKLFLFVVCSTPATEKEKLDAYLNLGLPGEIRNLCDIHVLPGKVIKSKLSWLDRFMLKLGARLTKDPIQKNVMLTDYNHVKKENITGLTNAVQIFMDQATAYSR